MTPTDDPRRELLTAYLDGELDPAAAADVERRLREDPVFLREAETFKRTWELLDFLPQPEPSEGFTSRTVSVAMPVIDAATIASPAEVSRGPWPMRLALAAGAAAALIIGYGLPGLFFQGPPKPLTLDEREELMARDLRVIEKLPQYQFADDLEFLQGLDSPDLFGD